MTLILIYITIAATSLLILFTLLAVLIRRVYMKKKYARLDEARERFKGLAGMLNPGIETHDLGRYRKKPGTVEWQAIEEALFKSLEETLSGPRTLSQNPHAPLGEILNLFDSLGFTDHYIERLKNGNRWEMALCADKLGRLGCKKALPPLVSALSSGYRDVRNMAIYSLGLIGDESAIEHLIGLLRRACGKTLEEYSIRIVKSSLISFGEAAAEPLINELQNPIWQVRAASVDILGEIRSQKVAAALRRALKDPEQDVRAKAAKGLGKLRDRLSVEGLAVLLADPHWVVRLHAARALGLIGDISAIEHVKARLNDENWQVRRIAAESLGRFGGVAYPALLDVSLKGSDRYAKEQADDELERAGVLKTVIKAVLYYRDRGKDSIIGDVGGMEKGVFMDIVRLLAGSGRLRLKEVLTSAAGKDASWFEIEDAATAIEKLAAECG